MNTLANISPFRSGVIRAANSSTDAVLPTEFISFLMYMKESWVPLGIIGVPPFGIPRIVETTDELIVKEKPLGMLMVSEVVS